MEQIVRERIYPELKGHTPQLRLSPLLLIVIIMLVGFAVVMLGVRALAQYTPSPPNPFPAYADVFPGQPASAVEARSFSCQNYAPAETACTLTPAEGAFLSVQAVISESTVYNLIFILRDNSLQVGDLERFLEVPISHRLYHTVYFFLPTSVVRAETINQGERFSLFLPVQNVSFTKLT